MSTALTATQISPEAEAVIARYQLRQAVEETLERLQTTLPNLLRIEVKERELYDGEDQEGIFIEALCDPYPDESEPTRPVSHWLFGRYPPEIHGRIILEVTHDTEHAIRRVLATPFTAAVPVEVTTEAKTFLATFCLERECQRMLDYVSGAIPHARRVLVEPGVGDDGRDHGVCVWVFCGPEVQDYRPIFRDLTDWRVSHFPPRAREYMPVLVGPEVAHARS
jgi:hypothetical protein